MSQEQTEIIEIICEATDLGASQSKTCNVIQSSTRTSKLWSGSESKVDGRIEAIHNPKNQQSEHERQQIITVANQAAYADLPPCKIVPKLLTNWHTEHHQNLT
ncbi:MAG: putative transposase [Enterobacterales bacterium]|jgi:putative transposase